uniref:KN motif and ankyrin repeat domains 2 n=1 Tax=Lepisosteus oculatus TaxID=7918 RepID=W5MLG3_LEPOC
NFNARVERTLLDARKKLEEDQKDGRRFSNLGSLHSSIAGSTSSLASQGYSRAQNGAQGAGGGGQFTPMSSGLSTPVSPTPAHLQHVREQMAVALRKIRELEEQVKMIPVLQVKISVLQEEKRQLSVQLKSQKFLGHTMGFGKGRSRGELYIDIPEEGTEPEAGAKREVRHIGVEVREQDLGVQSESEAWKTKASLLETQLRKTLQELHTAHRKLEALGKETAEKGQDAKPSMADAVMMTSIGWQELQQWGRPGEPSPLQTVVTFSQHPPCREQRTVGIQVYTLEQPTVVGVRSFQETTTTPRCHNHTEHRKKTYLCFKLCTMHSAICSKEVREVLQKSEVSSSVPVCSPAVVMETVSATQLVSNQLAPLCQRLKEGDMTQQTPHETAPAQEDNSSQPASPQSSLKSIMKRKDSEACTDSPNTKKNLQFIGVNGGYESTSSDSSSESSDSSSESEYHEANERLPPTQDAPRAHSEEAAPGPLQEATATAFPPAPSEGAAAEQDRSTTQETQPEDSTRLELSDTLMSACTVLQKALGETNAFSQQEARTAYTTVLQEWLRVSCHKAADAEVVRRYMVAFQAISPQLLEFIINMADGNGNTTLHYTVSHSNFPVVKLLLDTGLCNADKQNKAGYTAIMLTALAAFHSSSDLETVTQLLRTGDVNAKASQAGQTALMLAVSHGRSDMVGALLACGANVNLQDDDGSTALMCACEHGHVDIVKQLLAVPGCDATLTDNDGSTALSIAMEANQNDIAVLLYAHLNFAKPPSPVTQKAVLFGTVTP